MENNDSVCYINKINKIEPIEGADKIELATVNGWTSVVQKGIHKEGDLILCITTDAVIPEELATRWGVINYLRKGNRVRTVKLKGVYSECVLIPLKDIGGKYSSYEGADLMKELNIFKYEPPVREIITSTHIPRVYFKWNEIHRGKMWKSYTNYLIHTIKNKTKKYYRDNLNFNKYYKFPNQKNVPHMFSDGDTVVITRKIHGTNARYGIVKKNILTPIDRFKILMGDKWAGYEYVYGSHNVEKGSDSQGFYSTDVWAEIANDYDIKNKLWKLVKDSDKDWLGSGIILYGEIYGQGIQGEKYTYGLTGKALMLFDIEIDGIYQSEEYWRAMNNHYNFSYSVPLLYEGPWSKEIQDKYVLNQFIPNTNVPEEGIVVKCPSGDRDKINKVINPEYHTFSEKHLVPDSH